MDEGVNAYRRQQAAVTRAPGSQVAYPITKDHLDGVWSLFFNLSAVLSGQALLFRYGGWYVCVVRN